MEEVQAVVTGAQEMLAVMVELLVGMLATQQRQEWWKPLELAALVHKLGQHVTVGLVAEEAELIMARGTTKLAAAAAQVVLVETQSTVELQDQQV
jgi:hypothetical protein